MPESTTSVQLNCSAERLREFLGQTANIPQISDPELELEILEAPEQITAGATIEFRVSAYGFKQRITHKWTDVSATKIVAEQVDGPTRAWKHTQTIRSTGDASCQLTDHIDFEPPGGMLGFVMTADKVQESIEEGMEFRYETLQELLEDG